MATNIGPVASSHVSERLSVTTDCTSRSQPEKTPPVMAAICERRYFIKNLYCWTVSRQKIGQTAKVTIVMPAPPRSACSSATEATSGTVRR